MNKGIGKEKERAETVKPETVQSLPCCRISTNITRLVWVWNRVKQVKGSIRQILLQEQLGEILPPVSTWASKTKTILSSHSIVQEAHPASTEHSGNHLGSSVALTTFKAVHVPQFFAVEFRSCRTEPSTQTKHWKAEEARKSLSKFEWLRKKYLSLKSLKATWLPPLCKYSQSSIHVVGMGKG